MGFFSRKKATSNLKNTEIICDDESNFLITKWVQNEGWKFDDFPIFLELAGVKTPVKLSKLGDIENYCIKCITALNTEVTISLNFGEIWVTEEGETRKFLVNYNDGRTMPKVTLHERTISSKDGKKLICYYTKWFCTRILKLDKTHRLKIEMSEPNKLYEKSEIFVLRNSAIIEEYLLSLDNSLNDAAYVYEKLVALLGFSKEDISESESILISYIEEEVERSKILIKNGKMQEYAVTINGETFHVFKNNSWKYFSEGIQMEYLAEKKNYSFSITGSDNQIMIANPSEILSRVKLKIPELWRWSQNFEK